MNGDNINIDDGLNLVAEAKEHERSSLYDQAGEKYLEAADFFKNIGEIKLQVKCQAAHAVNMIKYYLGERDIEAFSYNMVESFIDEIDDIMYIDLEKIDKYDILISAYRELEKLFHDVNRIDKENEIYYKRMSLFHKFHWEGFKEKNIKCKEKAKYFSRFLFRRFLHGFYRHGEKPQRALLWILFIIMIFASLYKIFGLIEFNDQVKDVCFWQSLYFSVVTFTTLGYGDIVPIGYAGQILVVFEVFLGIVTIALFIPLIIKKLE